MHDFRNRLYGPAAALALSLAVGAAATPALADGEFLQLDGSDRSLSFVATAERGRFAYTLGRSDYAGGYDWNAAVTAKAEVPLGKGNLVLRLGPTVQYDSTDTWRFGAKVVAEHYADFGTGGVFLLGEYNTIKNAFFIMAQPQWYASGIGAEFSYQGNDTGFREETVVLSYRVKQSKVRLRLGYKFEAEEVFAGISWNTF